MHPLTYSWKLAKLSESWCKTGLLFVSIKLKNKYNEIWCLTLPHILLGRFSYEETIWLPKPHSTGYHSVAESAFVTILNVGFGRQLLFPLLSTLALNLLVVHSPDEPLTPLTITSLRNRNEQSTSWLKSSVLLLQSAIDSQKWIHRKEGH